MNKKLNSIDKKKIMIYAGIAFILILIIVIAIVARNISKNNRTEKERLTDYIQNKAENFYQDSYYPQVSKLTDDIETFLSNFQNEGISMSINVLIDNGAMTEEDAKNNMKNKDDDIKCDYDNTKAVIYPKSPYKKNSYDIRVQLDCGLKVNEKDK